MGDMISIPALAAQVAAREITVERLIADVLATIERANRDINAFITVAGERALADARRLDADLARGRYLGPLHGVPISVKDLVDVQGLPTTAGSRVRQGHLAAHDAPVVTRLRASGAVIVGKTNLHEFAYGTTSEDSAYGPVKNPHDLTRSAGGSSGGSAAAIVAGLCAGSVGTDTGGSIRIPSAACGVVGLKPTFDEVCADGVVPLSRSLDHVGPMAADVESTWLLYDAMTGSGRSPAEAGARAPADLTTVRFGVPRRYFMDLLDSEVRRTFESAVGQLRRAGASVTDVDIAHAGAIAAIYLHVQLPESSAYHAATLERAPELYSPAVRLRLEMGRYVEAEDYVRAQQGRSVLRREVDAALSQVDALVLPTLPIPAPLLGQATARLDEVETPVRAVMLRLTQLFNVTGHPAISIPSGRTRTGLPTSLQLAGRRGETTALLSIAKRSEEVLKSREM